MYVLVVRTSFNECSPGNHPRAITGICEIAGKWGAALKVGELLKFPSTNHTLLKIMTINQANARTRVTALIQPPFALDDRYLGSRPSIPDKYIATCWNYLEGVGFTLTPLGYI
jgi:hypothetical protein